MARKSRKNIAALVVEPIADITYNAAGYVRLSVEDNKKRGDSVETQKYILENFIATHLDIRLSGFYIDNGISGTTFEREAFQRMLADAESGKINCIIVKDLSRFGRNSIDAGYYIEKYLPKLGVRFISVTDDFDTNNLTANGVGFILPLKNIINEAYALDIGRKIRSQQQQAMKSGEYVGSRPPYGYLKSPDDCHKLVIDPMTAPVVRQIFGWAIEGVGLNDIVRRLNESKIMTPSHYRKEMGLITHENLVGKGMWQTFSVNMILSDEVYTGDMVQGKSKNVCCRQTKTDMSEWIRVPNMHEPIVTREIFKTAQKIRAQVSEAAKARQVKSYTPNIFKGKVFCGVCGGALHRQRAIRKKSDDIYYFHCLSNSRKARGSCVSFMMPEEELLAALLTTIQKHAETVMGKSVKLRKASMAIEADRDMIKAKLSAIRQDAGKDERILKSLYESLVNGVITADEFRDMRADYAAKVQEALRQAAELERRHKELDRQMTEYLELSNLVENAANSGITAKLIDALIDRILIFPGRRIEVSFRYDCDFDLIER